MSIKDGKNGMFISSSSDLGKDDDQFIPKDSDYRENMKQEYLRP